MQYEAMTVYIDYEDYDAAPAENSQSANAAAPTENSQSVDAAASTENSQDANATAEAMDAPANANAENQTNTPMDDEQDMAAMPVPTPSSEEMAAASNQMLHMDSLTIYAENIQVLGNALTEQETEIPTSPAPAEDISDEIIPAEGPSPVISAQAEQTPTVEKRENFPWQLAAIAIGALILIGIVSLIIVTHYRNKKAKVDDTATRQRFYRLTDIDTQQKNAKPAVYNNNVTLEGICQQFRDYAASQLHLYYSLDMIRTFIASFAASRLIIMQGISGTGKTSLAYAFGKFVENDSTIIPVQPSWRDRSDLLGYFNEFTKRFNETELLSTIYEAGYNDDVYIAVLDEMNIARVEYYFAEFLSILEMPSPEEWVVNIVPDHWALDPKKLEGGKLHLPRNMWYIGTANNDDSTFAISDKVYDRAMILDIDSRAERFSAPPTQSLRLSADTFEKLLKEAANRYRISDENLEKINQLDTYIIQHLRVAFGNRIMNQFYRFVPAYMACGGEELRGIDYILCKKVLRKFENQNMAYIRDEIDDLCDYLDEMFGRNTMSISLEYLRRLKKMG